MLLINDHAIFVCVQFSLFPCITMSDASPKHLPRTRKHSDSGSDEHTHKHHKKHKRKHKKSKHHKHRGKDGDDFAHDSGRDSKERSSAHCHKTAGSERNEDAKHGDTRTDIDFGSSRHDHSTVGDDGNTYVENREKRTQQSSRQQAECSAGRDEHKSSQKKRAHKSGYNSSAGEEEPAREDHHQQQSQQSSDSLHRDARRGQGREKHRDAGYSGESGYLNREKDCDSLHRDRRRSQGREKHRDTGHSGESGYLSVREKDQETVKQGITHRDTDTGYSGESRYLNRDKDRDTVKQRITHRDSDTGYSGESGYFNREKDRDTVKQRITHKDNDTGDRLPHTEQPPHSQSGFIEPASSRRSYNKGEINEDSHHSQRVTGSASHASREVHDKAEEKPDYNFDFSRYRLSLNRIFFRDQDLIPRGSKEYGDFWTFLNKYQAYQKKKAESEGAATDTGTVMLSVLHVVWSN